MNRFILFNVYLSEEISKVVSCAVSLMLTLTWGVNTVAKTQKEGDEFEKQPLYYEPGLLGMKISCKACLLFYYL